MRSFPRVGPWRYVQPSTFLQFAFLQAETDRCCLDLIASVRKRICISGRAHVNHLASCGMLREGTIHFLFASMSLSGSYSTVRFCESMQRAENSAAPFVADRVPEAAQAVSQALVFLLITKNQNVCHLRIRTHAALRRTTRRDASNDTQSKRRSPTTVRNLALRT